MSEQLSFDVDSPRLNSPETLTTAGQEPIALEFVEETPHILSVSALTGLIRKSLESQFGLVWVQGEISNFKPHSSGHYYFSVKDSKSQIAAVMFRGHTLGLKFKPQEGMEVIIRGRVSVYEPRGSYQLYCELMEPVGLGALQLAFEQLKKKLQSEGLFDPLKKRKLPALPARIAIVTSPTGAAIRDMLTVLNRRFRGVEIVLFPCAVQGVNAPKEIVQRIQQANRIGGFDVMIVGRGGGSIEDLWSFNEEIVARAIAASRIPTISAVGHEIDFTIADFVADVRAPTPSAAAEIVVPSAQEMSDRLRRDRMRLLQSTLKRFEGFRGTVRTLEKGVIDPRRRLMDLILRCDELSERLGAAVERFLEGLRSGIVLRTEQMGSPLSQIKMKSEQLKSSNHALNLAMRSTVERMKAVVREKGALLDSLSPLKVVDRGYSIVTQNKEVVKSVTQLRRGDVIEILLSEGDLTASVQELNAERERNGI